MNALNDSKIKDKIVYVAMSGGVDSSVAAALLKERGFNVFGVYMKTWSPEGMPCTSTQDRKDAVKVCAKLGIPFKTWDFTVQYKEKVVQYMISEYASGRTPNPDVMCNRDIKFGMFFNQALKEGADYIATGHYARIATSQKGLGSRVKLDEKLNPSGYTLMAARDRVKDQSYFLWTLKQEHLAKTLFPIGEFESKAEVRAIAEKLNLPTASKKDSQGVCFVGPINVYEFLRGYIPANPGPIVTVSGQKVGKHSGLPFYTIGQRQGIGVGGTGPYYVARKEAKTNTLVVAPPAREEELMSRELEAKDINWIGRAPKEGDKIKASIRYRQAPVDARIMNCESGIRVVFKEPIRAITPGQSVVVYRDDEVLGGGIIE